MDIYFKNKIWLNHLKRVGINMTKTMIRLASEQDAEKLQQLMHEAFTPLRELGIDWPSVNANLDAVKENIDKNTTFVMTIDDEIISTITVRYPWGSVKSISGYPLSGGLRQILSMKGKAMVANYLLMLKKHFCEIR